ncbi:MAG: hypothetical protein A2312_04585 [Candidatus Staskawiczbacteria bacterium RIFOXYB2_FULL_32_9]|uniref:Uncharacterized protein n=1 Tax=Candidatus Staskawiczbacteria bacterium RIFOXYD1_FULL_32_13 TaxID=1802234 RepID=A0A1G2JMN1_9BACT|nr:MAG: hypothetical protein UR22_C0028G0003 [Parcubacteria group bacterium GW2011_GWC2_32_10]OGZ79217.1 MAG: hypothetical protein A2360_05180 [Candidatus Staskawiczbacteria bacterium RIFOXYB1_FULL_32_11]OGZ83455.1 MAG: hypothetical protein A2312_04585 [Candidatus Staskawiczbacteria bacterium RIFOXYB2_FULL_32_9]OGZ87384.1 MAG: hypothetical protein A2463_02635 [Candidatus Staskawiczbacteria bacterium RIFOXYC2_FULL_32_10]OGZ88407.1 MAG: hypothetical protein A2561_02930 [Candidatus Staskawiczbacte
MTAQTQETQYEGLKAYTFVVRYGDNAQYHTEDACIAGSRDEALAIVKAMRADLPGQVSFFDTAFAVMQPAIIEWWLGSKRFEEKGCYAFLQGFFFCKCGDHQKVTHCAKEENRNGWTAVIYGNNHQVKPL